MKYLMFVFILALGYNSFSQTDNFIFIQAKKNESFYVKIGDKTFISSSFGHLVIPKLSGESMKLTIGFSRMSIAEQDFELKLNGKNRGYELNIENDTQLFLYEWQTSSKIPTTTPQVFKASLSVKGIKRTDPYAMLMSGVVNDSLVLFTQMPVEKTELAKVPEIIQNPMTDTTVTTLIPVTGTPVNKPPVNEPAASEPTASKPVTNKSAANKPQTETEVNEPFRRVVTSPSDSAIAKKDSVVGVTPPVSDSAILVQSKEIKLDSIVSAGEKIIEAVSLIEESSSPDEKKLIYLINETKERIEVIITKDSQTVISENRSLIADSPISDSQVAKNADSVEDRSGVVLVNSDCQRIANDSDVDRLRIQMLKEANDDDRVFAARKILRTKCFTVKQIRALTEIFQDDAARYMFFDAAYPFVYDSGNFKSLISFLADEYYINRFKALVRM